MIKVGAEILGGYSLLPKSEYMIPYMKPSGEVDWNKLNVMLQRIANAGASYVREFPYWPTNAPGWNEHLAPFWRYQDKSVVWNDQYFKNWTNIFRFMKEQYNLTPVFVLFNASETRVAGADNHFPKENSPWNYFKDFFYSQDAKDARHEFIDRIIESADDAGVDIWLEMVNEPPPRAEEMMSETLEYLVTKKKFPMNQIITGWDIHRIGYDGVYAKAYRAWKKEAIKMLTGSKMFKIEGETRQERDDYVSQHYLKGALWTTFHACTPQTVDDYFGPTPADLTSRNQVYSTDGSWNDSGERLGYIDIQDLFSLICDTKPKSINIGKVFMSILIDKESTSKAPYVPIEAACNAAIQKGYTLENRYKYPVPLPLPEWIEEKPEPETKRIAIISPYQSELMPRNTKCYLVQWGFTENIGEVDFMISTDIKSQVWRVVEEKAPNLGGYTWRNPFRGIEGNDLWVRVRESDGTAMDTNKINIIDGIKADEMKGKPWRWIVGISSALLMAGLITFAPWYLGILGASQLYALRHFRIIK